MAGDQDTLLLYLKDHVVTKHYVQGAENMSLTQLLDHHSNEHGIRSLSIHTHDHPVDLSPGINHDARLVSVIRSALKDHDDVSLRTDGHPGFYCSCGERISLPKDWRPRSLFFVSWDQLSEDERDEMRMVASGDDKLRVAGEVWLAHRVQRLFEAVKALDTQG